MRAKARSQGRPKTSPLTRTEQLRNAKRLQREREHAAGFITVQLKLPSELARKLVVALRFPAFAEQLHKLIDAEVIDVTQYPVLADLMWNRVDRLVTARDAFGLYERNWRFVSTVQLQPEERQLLDGLKQRFGAGLINA